MAIERATLGAGCFWGAEARLRELEGVLDTRVGYALEAESEGPEIEVVQVDFDPTRIGYPALLEHFWTLHDPTSRDRQGEHSGAKYRSAIFTHSAEHAALAGEAVHLLEASGRLARPVVTRVLPLGRFTLAGEEHQRYLEKHGLPACQL
ncbi:peptide-methionine (S)-S-oxide reductase MsrA [Metapseudomonas resinovorans]|uniref:peptide-methionine (S)-S-oxide reductase MsrA n=1 Tax=Metapseudomonas resinovorans TaxID=53412 RepID=UPI001E565DBF|nr:peptide-methionine (S)-S-oxide reductase MsrA [Pseudomonas resinovorans]